VLPRDEDITRWVVMAAAVPAANEAKDISE
jgi:hypothetical protein